VALKQARDPGNADEARRMRREARHAASLEHEHVVALHDVVFDDDGHPWLVMEYILSPSLAELIESGRLEPRRTARIGAQIAEALAAAHHIKLVHRDVKPGNVLFRRIQGDGAHDHAKLTDFGIARRAADATFTDGGATGTAAYMSPEVADGQTESPASDVFSLGSTLYAAVFGAPPFGTDGDPSMIMRRIRGCKVEFPPGAGPLEPVLRTLLARAPTDRRRRDAAPGGGGRPPVPVEEPLPTGTGLLGRHRRWLPTAVLAGVALVALIVGFRTLLPTGSTEVQPPEPAAPPPATSTLVIATGLLGDIRTADPCALIDRDALQGFGTATSETDVGGFARCDVSVVPTPGTEVDVKIEFFGPLPHDQLCEPAKEIATTVAAALPPP